MGRKAKYEAVDYIDEILEWVSNGRTLRSYCRQEAKPSWQTVYRWMDKDKVFADRFAESRDRGFDSLAQQCLDIAENGNPGDVARAKLRVWTTLQLLAKWDPRRYGEVRRLEHTGDQKQTVTVVTGVPQPDSVKLPPLPVKPAESNDSDPKVSLKRGVNNEETDEAEG